MYFNYTFKIYTLVTPFILVEYSFSAILLNDWNNGIFVRIESLKGIFRFELLQSRGKFITNYQTQFLVRHLKDKTEAS